MSASIDSRGMLYICYLHLSLYVKIVSVLLRLLCTFSSALVKVCAWNRNESVVLLGCDNNDVV